MWGDVTAAGGHAVRRPRAGYDGAASSLLEGGGAADAMPLNGPDNPPAISSSQT